MIRLFSALSIPEIISQKLSEIRTDLFGARWLPSSSYHATLVFMGDVNVYLYRQIRQQLINIEFKPFTIQVKGLEAFVNEKRKSHVLTAKIEPCDTLSRLQKESGQLISMFHPNLKLNHTFTPHVTLARLNNVDETTLGELIEYNKDTDFGTIEINVFHLFASRLTQNGSVYSKLESYFAQEIPEENVQYSNYEIL